MAAMVKVLDRFKSGASSGSSTGVTRTHVFGPSSSTEPTPVAEDCWKWNSQETIWRLQGMSDRIWKLYMLSHNTGPRGGKKIKCLKKSCCVAWQQQMVFMAVSVHGDMENESLIMKNYVHFLSQGTN